MATTYPKASAVKSMLETVSKGAHSLGSIFDTATKSIGMVDAFVTKAANQQELRYRKDKRVFVHNLVREAAEDQAEADMRVVEFCKQSPDHKNLYEKSYDEFAALFAEELGQAPS